MNRKGIAYLSFTEQGAALAEQLRGALGGEASCTRRDAALSLAGWTAEQFPVRRALVYVGAVGIAVRAVAPHLKGKVSDPAVVAVDECGRFAVSVLSGHLGGANQLTREIAAVCGATAVITTATDTRGVFAIDEWARYQDCAVIQPEGIRTVSGKLLAGERIRIWSAYPIAGNPPENVILTESGDGADVRVDTRRHGGFRLVPRVLVLGTGCRRGTARETLERRFARFCGEYRLSPEAFCAAAAIDRKADEPGLLAFCAEHGWSLRTYGAAELRRVPGEFTASAFVEARTGVENVCERSAVLAAGGPLIVKKYAGEGVTLAAAMRPFRLDWRWRDG